MELLKDILFSVLIGCIGGGFFYLVVELLVAVLLDPEYMSCLLR